MVNVTADFPPHNLSVTCAYGWADGATVADLKTAVSADGNAPLPFQGQLAAGLDVSQGGATLTDPTALGHLLTYDVDLVMADDDDIPSGYQAPPNSPRDGGGGDGDGGGGLANGPLNPHQDGVIVWYYANGAQHGPQQYHMAADSTVAALKGQVAADPGSPLGPVASKELAVYDGSNWLGDNDPVVGGAAYTIQRVAP
jgi:hypothetical protein